MLDFHNNQLFTDAPVAYSVLDADGQHLAANRKFWELFGYPEDSPISVAAITSSASQEETSSYLTELAQGLRDSVTVDKVYVRADGTEFWGRITAQRLVVETGETLLLGVIEDIDEQRELEAQLRQAAQAQSEFVARVSHELRNPLHTIAGIAELFATADMGPEVSRSANIVLREALNLTSIVSDLLDIGKFDSGNLQIDPIPFSARTLIDRSVRSAKIAAEAKGLVARVTVHDGLPRNMIGDPGRLGQVIDNMLGNAIKFTDVGSVELDVRAMPDNIIEFSVTDTGSGVPEDRQAEIFEPFQRLNPSAPGAGLGLAISARLAQSMGGELSLRSSSPAGSTFLLAVPLPITHEEVADMVEPTEHRERTSRVLVVEDNPETQMLASAQLTRLGYEHEIVGDGFAALEITESNYFGAILMDWHLPGIDGLETTRRFRQREEREGRERTPIISVTARAMAADVQACRDAGADDFVAKPASIHRIAEALDRWAGASEDAEAPSEPSSVNSDAFATLMEELEDKDLVISLANTFLTELPRRIAVIVDPASAVEESQLAAHTLKSTSAMVGAESLRSIAADIEASTRDGEPVSIEARDELQAIADRTDTEVRELITSLEEAP